MRQVRCRNLVYCVLLLVPWARALDLYREAFPLCTAACDEFEFTLPDNEYEHPYELTDKSDAVQACYVGCAYFMHPTPTQATCAEQCATTFQFHGDIGYNDAAELSRLGCVDGCNLAYGTCMPGFACANGTMEICPPGTYRAFANTDVSECVACPVGRYRVYEGGTGRDSCSECPTGFYVNHRGATSLLECQRCPAGRYGNRPGLGKCFCITEDSCDEGWPEFGRW